MEVLKRAIISLSFLIVVSIFGFAAYAIYSANDPELVLQNKLVDKNNNIARAFFSPDDNIKSILIGLIKAEKKRILTAIYTFTDNEIAQAFLEAFKRGVEIEIVADRSFGTDRYSRVPMLANNKLAIWVYQTSDDDKKTTLMHDKFCLFEQNILNKSIVFSGSFNFTKRANEGNQEAVIVLDIASIYAAFISQFGLLRQRSILISGNACQLDCVGNTIELYWWEKVGKWLGWIS